MKFNDRWRFSAVTAVPPPFLRDSTLFFINNCPAFLAGVYHHTDNLMPSSVYGLWMLQALPSFRKSMNESNYQSNLVKSIQGQVICLSVTLNLPLESRSKWGRLYVLFTKYYYNEGHIDYRSKCKINSRVRDKRTNHNLFSFDPRHSDQRLFSL